MSPQSIPGDQSQRQLALEPERSFIVQAPAGSGKTELLIQRYLRLLATVAEPEEVLAVTFTRKAAGEMRSRVIAALQAAADNTVPEQPHLRHSRELARAILDHPQRRDWQLLRHPARLRISTIDSVNGWLAGRTPLLGGSGVLGRVTDTPEYLYREAARATLDWLAEEGPEEKKHVEALLSHLDNDTERFERLLVDMLSKRDQWLRQVLAADSERESLEKPLRELTAHHLQLADAALDDALKMQLTSLLSFAASQYKLAGKPPGPWLGRQVFPGPEPENLPLWRALVGALLTSENAFRKQVTVTDGFPPKCVEKAAMMALLTACAERSALRDRLIGVRSLPGNSYGAGQWEILQHLLAVLKLAAAELRLAFAARGSVDFPEVASAALQALGEPQAPSSLGLSLDHRIRHILIDEFQDTSLSQFELICRLIEGWEPGDGRTVFLVGDPMQSIYRFRHAEVGVFMRVRDEGIGTLRPEFLQLTANFRSGPPLVEWFNAVFSRTFPRYDDALHGTVRYTASQARSGSSAGTAGSVSVHWLAAGDADDEAEGGRVADLVRMSLDEAPEERICILVRSRSHATPILKALRIARLHFVAPEIENLEHSGVAQDLLALTRALLHPADRLAWIGVLRAPWCGLSLVDLHALLGHDLTRPVPELLSEESGRLGPAAQAAVTRLGGIVQGARAVRGRRALRDLVEGAWLDLGGAATLREEAEIDTARTFFTLLESADAGGDCSDVLALAEQMRNRKGSLGSGDAPVQIMTMHKAKGLEFDTVILPGLSRKPRSDTLPLLAWQVIPTGKGRSAAVLAPPPPSGVKEDPLYRYLLALERDKQSAEIDRLLYVACTRARRRLHLLGRLASRQDGKTAELTLRKPEAGSLLAHLWPALRADAERELPRLQPVDEETDSRHVWVQPLIRRLPARWQMPPVPPRLFLEEGQAQPKAADTPVYEWASRWAMQAGSVVHRWLQIIAEQGVERYDTAVLERLRPLWRRQLSALGAQGTDLERGTQRVADALKSTLGDAMGRWILGADHVSAECEVALTVCENGAFRHVVIDRTLVTAEGARWLIDYKTSTHEGGDIAAFIALECERHRAQLRLYRKALSAIDSLPVRAALYFPLLGVFRELDPDTAT